uniref:Uncharacterized protein n=1 Tax=Rhizophora mucronata TaxID=61149 RepID=A0A2P2Q5Y6_RHIMU
MQNPMQYAHVGTKIEAEVHGKRQLKLLNHGETYVMNSPKLLIGMIPPGVDWVGDVRICCRETGLEAELHYTTSSVFNPRGGYSIRGKIRHSSSTKTFYTINGHWNSTVTAKDIDKGKETIIYNAKEVITGLKTPEIRDLRGIFPSESAVVWSEVSIGILNKNWAEAREAKKAVEEKQRELARDRDSGGETWVPKHFLVSYSKENGFSSSPIEEKVPPAPIVVPL